MRNWCYEKIMTRQPWFDCIDQLIDNQYHEDQLKNKQYQFFGSKGHQDNKMPCFKSQFTTNAQTNSVCHIQCESECKRILKSIYQEQDQTQGKMCSEENGMKQQDESQQSQKADFIQSRPVKQSLYSKNYRQRKKQQLKILQEENNFLKKKINELQFRLREKQLQINRLKYAPIQRDLTIEKLNDQFLSKTNIFLDKAAIDPLNYAKTVYTPSDILYLEFLQSYDQHGFAGRRKKNILNYYFNQMLQALMRDSERYLFLMCNQSKDPNSIHGLETYEQIDSTFVEVMELNEQKIQRLNYFSKGLHPYMLELKDTCVQIYADFKKIVAVLDRVHSFMKQSYLTSYDFALKRIQFENWFEFQKHSKLMRRLRSDWLQFVKNQAQNGSEQKKKNYKGSKKKKLTSKDDSSLH